jgi:cytochrome P450 family 135
MVRLRLLGLGEVVAVSDPAAAKLIFTSSRELLDAGKAYAKIIPVLGPDALLLLDGERHLRMRRVLSPPLHGSAVRQYQGLIRDAAMDEAGRWPVGESFAIFPRVQAIALEVVLQAVLGVSDQQRLADLRAILPQVLEVNLIASIAEAAYPWLAKGRVRRLLPWARARREADRLLINEIAAHRIGLEDRDDILAVLMRARDKDGTPLTDEELADAVMTLLLAGHDSTAASLAWLFELLLRHPESLARLEEELREGESEVFLEAVVQETLRIQPVIEAANRILNVPCEIGGYLIPAGTFVMVSIRGVHRSAFAEADEFRPERFLGEPLPPHTMISFGGGSRRCPGASLAVMEMKTVVRAVLECAELRSAAPKPEREGRARRFTTVPARGARVVVSSKRGAGNAPSRHARSVIAG